MKKAGRPDVELPVSGGPKSPEVPEQPRAQLPHLVDLGDETSLHLGQGREPGPRASHQLCSE